MLQPIRQRDRLEIIIDTCSLGSAQLQAIDTLIDAIQKAEPRIYKDYSIVIPVQLGTEQRQRIYPAFLRAEMEQPLPRDTESNLRKFWQKHLDHIQIVDTSISQAYRLHYAKTALPLIQHDAPAQEKIVAMAQELAKRYGAKEQIKSQLTLENFRQFCDALSNLAARQEIAAQGTREDLQQYATTNLSNTESEKAMNRAELSNLARHQRGFEKTFPPEYVYFMQALYSESELYTQIARTPAFKDFRFNKGERAIEDFIFHERTENNPNLVSLIVSEDVEARDEIKALRDRSKNSVIVVDKTGLLHAVACLSDPATYARAFGPKPTVTYTPAPTPRQKWLSDPRNLRAERLAQAKVKTSEPPQSLNPANEHEWSLRLAKLIMTGTWRPRVPGRESAQR